MEGLFLFMAFSRVRKQDLKCISRMQCGDLCDSPKVAAYADVPVCRNTAG
jgi:hypothetical protein